MRNIKKIKKRNIIKGFLKKISKKIGYVNYDILRARPTVALGLVRGIQKKFLARTSPKRPH